MNCASSSFWKHISFSFCLETDYVIHCFASVVIEGRLASVLYSSFIVHLLY